MAFHKTPAHRRCVSVVVAGTLERTILPDTKEHGPRCSVALEEHEFAAIEGLGKLDTGLNTSDS